MLNSLVATKICIYPDCHSLTFDTLPIYEIILGVIVIIIGLFLFVINHNKIKSSLEKEVELSIGNEGIYIKRFKELGIIKWGEFHYFIHIHETNTTSRSEINASLTINTWKEKEYYEINLNLNNYTIDDYEEFQRKVNIYLKRSSEK